MKRLEVNHPVTALAAAFGVSRSGYYRWCAAPAGPRRQEDARLKIEIKTLHEQSRGTYGRPRLVAALRQRSIAISGRRVARLRRELGLRAKRKGGWRQTTTQSRHQLMRWPNRLRELAAPPSRPGVAWVSDMTYVRTNQGWLYVAAVLDAASRRLLGLAMGPRLDGQSSPVASQGDRQDGACRGPADRLVDHADQAKPWNPLCETYVCMLGSVALSVAALPLR